jgi:hypothetical protein
MRVLELREFSIVSLLISRKIQLVPDDRIAPLLAHMDSALSTAVFGERLLEKLEPRRSRNIENSGIGPTCQRSTGVASTRTRCVRCRQ